MIYKTRVRGLHIEDTYETVDRMWSIISPWAPLGLEHIKVQILLKPNGSNNLSLEISWCHNQNEDSTCAVVFQPILLLLIVSQCSISFLTFFFFSYTSDRTLKRTEVSIFCIWALRKCCHLWMHCIEKGKVKTAEYLRKYVIPHLWWNIV